MSQHSVVCLTGVRIASVGSDSVRHRSSEARQRRASLLVHLRNVLCCLAVQLQSLAVGVTTNSPVSRPLPQQWGDIAYSDQYWYVIIGIHDCDAWHKGQRRVLQWDLDHSAGNTFGCCVLQTGELNLYHNGRDAGVVWEGLPTDQPLWGFVRLDGGWKVEANYVIPKGEAVTCGVVVCAVCES